MQWSLPDLFPKQAEAWSHVQQASPGELVTLGYGGAMGGGKSYFSCWVALMYAALYPGARILVARAEERSLIETTMVIFKEEFVNHLPKEILVTEKALEFGIRDKTWSPGLVSTIMFSGLGNLDRFRSAEFTAIIIDEATDVSHETVRLVISRLRQQPGGKIPRYLFLACSNPYPGWFEEWFLEGTNDERFDKLEAEGKGRKRFIQSFMKDNPTLDDGYEDRVRATMNSSEIARLVEGKWNSYSGQAIPNFDWSPKGHMWQKSKPLPPFIRAIGGLDFGGAEVDAHYSAGIVRIILDNGIDIAVDEFREAGVNVHYRMREWIARMEAKWGKGRRIDWRYDQTQRLAHLALPGVHLVKNHATADARLANVNEIVRRFDKHPARGVPGGRPLSYLHESLQYLPDEIRKYKIDADKSALASKTFFIRKGDDVMDTYQYSTEFLYRRKMPLSSKLNGELPIIGVPTAKRQPTVRELLGLVR